MEKYKDLIQKKLINLPHEQPLRDVDLVEPMVCNLRNLQLGESLRVVQHRSCGVSNRNVWCRAWTDVARKHILVEDRSDVHRHWGLKHGRWIVGPLNLQLMPNLFLGCARVLKLKQNKYWEMGLAAKWSDEIHFYISAIENSSWKVDVNPGKQNNGYNFDESKERN